MLGQDKYLPDTVDTILEKCQGGVNWLSVSHGEGNKNAFTTEFNIRGS